MFPGVLESFRDWGQYLTFNKITKTIVDYQVVETPFERSFEGMLLTQTPQQLSIKPEGQRTWMWWTLVTDELLTLDDIIKDEHNTEYRLMTKSNFAIAGFYSYEIVEQYANSLEGSN